MKTALICCFNLRYRLYLRMTQTVWVCPGLTTTAHCPGDTITVQLLEKNKTDV